MKISLGFVSDLQFHHVCSLRAALAFGNVKLHQLTFFQGLETFTLDRGEVHEDVFAFLDGDKSVTFLRIEPFNCSSQT